MVKKILVVLILFANTLFLLALIELFFRFNRAHHFFEAHKIASYLHPAVAPQILAAGEDSYLEKIDWKFLRKMTDTFSDIRKLSKEKAWLSASKFYLFNPKDRSDARVVKNTSNGERVYDVSYHRDGHRRRLTPGVPAGAKKSIFLVGCSFTLGEGLQEDQTLAAHMQRYLSRTSVWNFGERTTAINFHLAELRKSNTDFRQGFFSEIPNQPTILVYLFIGHHVKRAQCPFSCYKAENFWMMPGMDFSIEKNGEARLLGSFSETRWFKAVVGFLADSAIEDALQLDWPTVSDESGYPKFLALITAFKNEIGAKVPTKDFYFVYHPDAGGEDPALEALAAATLKTNGFRVLDLRGIDLNKITGGKSQIPFDGHPSSEANFIISQVILNHIKQDHPDFQ